ncbi:MAG: flavodoxin family protein [Deltaproteobacteria bacterium]|nr:flavodoxin family protein [Deltaproteobacteria bacterium]RLA91512.1 MAG: flavodoxin family protein [Deltaproteobacteria bacterium]
MKVLGIYGSPRKKGNSDILLDKALEGAKAKGAEVVSIYVRDLKFSGCQECNACEKTGECIVDDDMQFIYPLLQNAEAIILATPVFFYGMTSQLKALIDRGQAMWSKRMLEKKKDNLKIYTSGKGYLIAVGATKGKNLFLGIELVARYFFDALDMEYKGGLFFKGVEKKGDILKLSEALKKAFEFGENIVFNKGE